MMIRASLGSWHLPLPAHAGRWQVVLITVLLTLATSWGAGVDETLIKQANESFDRADYEGAIKVLVELTTKQTGSLYLNQAKYKLGYAYFLKGDHANAIKTLIPLSDPKFPQAEIREISLLLLGQAYARAGDEEKKDPKKRNELCDKSIETYSTFISRYPQSTNCDEALFGRAMAKMYRGQFDDAIKDVDFYQKNYPKSSQLLDSQFLRATILGYKSAALIKAGSKQEGDKVREEARKLYEQLFNHRGDLALANQAAFSAAQLWSDAQKFDDAIFFYRKVATKVELVAGQQAKIAQMDEDYRKLAASPQVLQSGGPQNSPIARRAYEKLQLEKGKLEGIKNGPEFYVSACLSIAGCYMQQEKFEEARIMCQHLLDCLQGDANKEQRKIPLDTMFRVQCGLKDPDGAQKFNDLFQKEFPKDPIAQDNGLYLAKLYWMKERYDDALKSIDRLFVLYPAGTSTEEAVSLRGAITLSKGDPQKALEQIRGYLKQYPAGKFVAESQYHIAQINEQIGNYADAVKGFKEVREKYADQPFIEDANLQVGISLVLLGNTTPAANAAAIFTEAVTELTQFKERFATSTLMPQALLQLGDAHVGLLKAAQAHKNDQMVNEELEAAVTANKELLSKFPNDATNAPMAQYRLGLCYFWVKQYDKMAVAFDELAKKFPENPLVADAHFWVGYNFSLLKDYQKAAQEYSIVVEKYAKSSVAAEAALRVGQSYVSWAFTLGRSPAMMAPEKKKQWDEVIAKAMQAFEHTMAAYPAAPSTINAVNEILSILSIKLRNQLIDAAGVDTYFSKLLEGPAGKDNALKVTALFALGNLQLQGNDAKRAVATFDRAIKDGPQVELEATAHEAYAKALLATARYDDAIAAYKKMADVAKKGEQWDIWPDAVYGIGNGYFLKRDFANARNQFELFTSVADKIAKGQKGDTLSVEQRALYNSKSKPEAQLGMGNILFEEKKYDEAVAKYEEYIKTSKGTTRPRARAVLGLGRALMARAAGKPADQAKPDLESAFANFSKAADFYTAYDEVVAEGLFLSGQSLEKLQRFDEARKIYEDLIKRFPNDAYTSKGRESLAKLPPPAPPTKQ